MTEPRYASVRSAAAAEVGAAIAMAAGGAAAFALVEYPLTLWMYAGEIGVVNALRLLALVATLSACFGVVLAVVLGAVLAGLRCVRALIDPVRGRAVGWLGPPGLERGIRAAVPQLWSTVILGGVSCVAIQRTALWATRTFKEPHLTASLIAVLALAIVAAAWLAWYLLAFALAAAASALARFLRAFNPLGRWRAAGVALAALSAASLGAWWLGVPQSRSVFPFRIAISGIAVALGMGLGKLYVPRWRRPRRAARWVAGAGFALVVLTLWRFGADPETRYIAITASPSLEKLIAMVRVTNDFDRDGFGSVLGDNDCAPFDAAVNPGAYERPTDGIDQDCDGRDLSWAKLIAPAGPTKPVPAKFQRQWNFLLITIDTLRYDRTTFGGYAQQLHHRNTTPNLAKLVERSTSFRFCQASAPGTMASIPAILTSKFFHSGIALKDRPGGIPPKLLPQNTTLPEIMKRGGYVTGAIGSHQWWTDWGLDQGVDEYDNSIGKHHNPFDSTAHKVTDHALAFVSRHRGEKWFLWAHYLDPHGRYVAHPDVVDYGRSEPDLYDAEVQWTDQQIGRLLDELRRIPGVKENTIIVITSDHGDSMAEHNVPLGTHGTALYRELLHVPLIFYIPENFPRLVDGVVTNLDIVPTIAELAGIDVTDLSFEGRSLVPALFYGIEDHERVVFAETNAPARQRAAISERWKLIYYFRSNLYELFDLRKDPWEHTNLAHRDPQALAKMRSVLQGWIARVVNARDPLFNQAFRQISDLLLDKAPSPAVTTQGQRVGGIEIVGIDTADGGTLATGTSAEVIVYLHVREPTTTAYRFGLVAWPAPDGAPPTSPVPATAYRTPPRLTANGAFSSNQWRAGDYIRQRFKIRLPATWTGRIAIGLVALDGNRAKVPATGPAPSNDPSVAVLGTLPAAPATRSP